LDYSSDSSEDEPEHFEENASTDYEGTEMLESSKITAEYRKKVEKMLKSLRDNGIHTSTDTALNVLCWKDFPALQQAQATLTLKSKEKKLMWFSEQVSLA